MKTGTFTSFAALAVVLFAGVAHADMTPNNNSVVRDATGNIVRAVSNGSCVRSFSVEGTDVCGPQTSSVQTTRTALSDDERVVYFEFNRSDLTPAAQANLNAVVNRLKTAQDVKSASIVGYADRIGSSEYNVALSQRRAESVKNYLVRNGYLDVNVVQTRALGKSQPITNCAENVARNEQIACLSPDRRVELELVYANQVRVSQTTVQQPAR